MGIHTQPDLWKGELIITTNELLQKIKEFAEENFCNEGTEIYGDDEEFAVTNPWMDHSGRFPLDDEGAVKEWGLAVVVDFIEKAKEEINMMDNKYNYIKDATVVLNPDSETPVSIEGSVVRADWYDANEGFYGDYNPENPDDVHLLRFDIYIKKDVEWEPVDDASYCTRVPFKTDIDTLVKLLYSIYKEYDNVLSSDPDVSVKKLGEALSWISD